MPPSSAPFKKKVSKKTGGNMHAAAPESATGYEGTEFPIAGDTSGNKNLRNSFGWSKIPHSSKSQGAML